MADQYDDQGARQGGAASDNQPSDVAGVIKRRPYDQRGQQSDGLGSDDNDHEPGDSGSGSEQRADPGGRQGDDVFCDEFAEVQQSAQREGMGRRQHSNRANEQALDADADIDNVGTRNQSASRSRNDKPGQ